MVQNRKTDGFLVIDMGERVNGLDEAYGLTTSKDNPGPVTRSIFTIHRAEKMDIFGGPDDHTIRFGQKVKLMSTPYIYRKKLYVSSYPLSPSVFSPVSRKQEASVNSKDCYNNVWVIDSLNPNDRFERQGEPVKANEPILFRHCQTQHYLASDECRVDNDFGGEREVMTHSFVRLNRTQNLALEGNGNITGDVPTKFQEDQNVFFMITAPNASYAQPIEKLEAFNIEDLIKEIKEKVLQRSANGIKGLARIFKAMDDNGNRSLDVDDFRWGFIDYGFNLSKDEAQSILDHFDKNKDGMVSYDEFLLSLRGDMNDFRKKWVRCAYDKLDHNKNGKVELNDIAAIYDAS